ncbi:hypothetical protein K439DRAFT_1630859 [Ramaria rubella]|nr:hypothetical protein K439DRAFT_1630859 [Ramaria rubella]
MLSSLWWTANDTHISSSAVSPSPPSSLIPNSISQPSLTVVSATAGTIGPNPSASLSATLTNNPMGFLANTASETPSSRSPILSSALSGFSLATVPITDGIGNVAVSFGGNVCIGHGIDVTSIGVLASTVLCSFIGLLLWLLFGYLRPRFRQIYSTREWFIAPELRPQPLHKSFWAFLWPHVPLIPPVPSDVSSYSNGRNPRLDAMLFPSDEELAQRTIWHAFLLVLAWSVIGLGGALPLYLVDTPCVADTIPTAKFGGQYSTLQDLSLFRLLNLLTNENINTAAGPFGEPNLFPRATVDGTNVTRNTEVRLIVLTVLVVALAALPALYKLLREFTRLTNYRKRWIDVKCGGIEMGWLGEGRARGFHGWGENQLKEFLIKAGLSTGFKNDGEQRQGFAGVGANGRSARASSAERTARDDNSSPGEEEKARPEIDLQGLFTVTDTTQLAILVDERDIILNNLEVAEARYINSFRLSTPSPSVVDFETPQAVVTEHKATNDLKRHISRPRALSGSSISRKRQHRRRQLYTPGATPTSYVAPSLYYKLRDIRGVGKMSTGSEDSLAQRISQRVIGSRFQEIHRDSFAFGRIPLGSHVQLDNRTGALGPVRFSQDQLLHGPNDPSSGNEANIETPLGQQHHSSTPDSYFRESSGGEYNTADAGPSTVHEGEEWIPPTTLGLHEPGVRRRPANPETPPSSERRSTFPMRSKPVQADTDTDAVQPPHLRLQPQQPFVRPISGMDHDDLGIVYNDIRLWRSRLKAINVEIAEAQATNYNNIADGVDVKGWLLVGRGVHFIPGVEMIEGRSKEDIRYGELQAGDGKMYGVVFWTVVAMVTILLGASLVAVSGLAVAPAPNVTHILTFLRPLSNTDGIGAALATTLVPTVAASLFIALALLVIHYAARFNGSVSVSSVRITAFKATFFILTVVCCIWLVACGSMIFALEAFASSSGRTQTVASGSVYFSAFLLVLIINVAIISPALLLLQPLRLWRLLRREKSALTPRQRFRAVYPRVYDPTYATACCLVAVTFAATFSLIFPLIGPAVCLLLFLTLIAHRYLVGYVYVRIDSSYTGGLLQIWLLRCLADLVALQPLLLGLILMTRQLWTLGGILVGAAVLIVCLVEGYAWHKLRLPGVKSLSPITQDSLTHFGQAALPEKTWSSSEDPSVVSSPPRRGIPLPRSSMASVLEMMSLTLAVMPSNAKARGSVPLQTEDLDDLTATEQAARTNPIAPPHLPSLPFMTHSEEMQGILYTPELIAPPPVIWLPNDSSGVAQSEAVDLFRYHDLKTTLDVTPVDAIRQSNDSGR